MAKQGERYNPKTKTGWKWEKGRSVYYKKGKKLNTRQHLGEAFAPLVSGAETIRDKLRIHPDSETGETVFRHNKRLDEAQDNYDDSADVAAYQKYEKGANESNALGIKLAALKKKNQAVNTAETSVGPPEKSVQYGGGSGSRKVDGKALMDQLRSEQSDDRQDWLDKTRNSAAAKSGAFTNEQRWQQQLKHREWKEKRKNKKKLSIDD